jgi:hypothetical protein
VPQELLTVHYGTGLGKRGDLGLCKASCGVGGLRPCSCRAALVRSGSPAAPAPVQTKGCVPSLCTYTFSCNQDVAAAGWVAQNVGSVLWSCQLLPCPRSASSMSHGCGAEYRYCTTNCAAGALVTACLSGLLDMCLGLSPRMHSPGARLQGPRAVGTWASSSSCCTKPGCQSEVLRCDSAAGCLMLFDCLLMHCSAAAVPHMCTGGTACLPAFWLADDQTLRLGFMLHPSQGVQGSCSHWPHLPAVEHEGTLQLQYQLVHQCCLLADQLHLRPRLS